MPLYLLQASIPIHSGAMKIMMLAICGKQWNLGIHIWARTQYGDTRIYPQDVFQVVGHTPVRTAIEKGNILTLDNFSTYRDGRPIGDERFVWIDTVEKTWGFVEESMSSTYQEVY